MIMFEALQDESVNQWALQNLKRLFHTIVSFKRQADSFTSFTMRASIDCILRLSNPVSHEEIITRRILL